jgi:hypothetical protein
MVALAVALAAAGCSSSGSGASIAGGAPVAHAGSGSQANDSVGSPTTSGDVVKRQVVTTGSVVIRTPHPIAVADRAAKIVDDAGGRVDDRNQTAATATSPANASLTLRIPSSRLTQTLARLKKIGTEVSISESTDDVTTKSEDLGARITALQTSITRLLALEAKATNTADVITLENDISSRQGDLESLTAQQRYLSDQVAMSTIKLRLIAPSVVIAKPGPTSAASAFFAGFAGFGVVFTWIFLVLVYLLPWLVLAAVIWVGIVLLVRWRRRRTGAATTPAPPAS